MGIFARDPAPNFRVSVGDHSTGGGASRSSVEVIVTSAGEAIPIPSGASGPHPTINKGGEIGGFEYTGGAGGHGMNERVTGVRIMFPKEPRGRSPGYPNGYVVYMNETRQSVNRWTGNTVSNSDPHAHIPLACYRDPE